MDAKWARPWFALTAAAVLVEMVITLTLAAQAKHGLFDTAAGRVFNVFWYFTIQSNLIVGVTCLLLALRLDRSAPVFRVFRLIGVVGIAVTFVVFHVALSSLLDLDTWGQTANQLQHTVVPVLAIVGWLAFGPRGLTSSRVARLTVLFPAVYIVATAIRGPLAHHFYPYPFADVTKLGYVRVAINGAWISLFFFALAAGATALDGRLGGGGSGAGAAREEHLG